MKNKKIVFANQKGGVGKSTLCILFANYLAWKKQDVCIIDTDLQKTIMMQRKKDKELYPTTEEPYNVQDFDVADPETMQQLMDSASQTEGYVLFDSPGNVSEDGLVPMFTNADYMDSYRCSPMPTISSVLMSMRRRPSTPPVCSFR